MLIFLYCLSTSGLALNLHFCGKKLAKVQFLTQKVTSCCSEKAEQESGCCSNQVLKNKVSDSHTPVENSYLSTGFSFVVPTCFFALKNIPSEYKKPKIWCLKAPPKQKLNQHMLCVFRI